MKNIPKVVLLLELEFDYARQLLSGIARFSNIWGPWAFYQKSWCYSPRTDVKTSLKKMIAHIRNWRPDGIIMRDGSEFRELLDLNVPTICIIGDDENAMGKPYIGINDDAVGRMGALHLIDRGHTHLGFCGIANFWSRKRAAAFLDEVHNADKKSYLLELGVHLLKKSWEKEEPLAEIVSWLHQLPKPVGIMAPEDNLAMQVIEACKLAGYVVPEKVSVLGVHNDLMLCSLSDPPLSSIILNADLAGFEAAVMLDQMMKGQIPEQRVITIEPTNVMVRRSTDFYAIHDSLVSEAIVYIRNHSDQILQVEDVARQFAMSRRTLEMRFKKAIKRSIYQEIKSNRADYIVKLLTETNMPIYEIAASLGYTSINHISRFFEREKGISPSAFRQKFKRCGRSQKNS